jgi:hypothetical protein
MRALFRGSLYRTTSKQNAFDFVGAVNHIMSFQMVYDMILLTQCFLCSDSESSFFDSVDDSSGIDDLAVREAIAVESASAQDESVQSVRK